MSKQDPTSKEVEYVRAGDLPRVRQAEESWVGSWATVVVALAVTYVLLTLVGWIK